MVKQILSTKLYIPRPRPRVVRRPRLIECLNEGLHRKLTLTSAPAGFGKTTLVSEWIVNCDRQAAWLSLDEGDSEPIQFLTHFVAALQTIAPHVGDGIVDSLRSPQPLPINTLLTTLLNEITTMALDFVLVLDDYHILDSQAIDSAITFLVENQPPRMHLVINTREDPRLPLPRLRARGQLNELRATDLRFTLDEATDFLNHAMGLNLLRDDVALLETRTEGWITGLQLAALSMQGREDIHEFIKTFAGDHRYIVDYLADEVLRPQPDSVRNFLLQTAILNRLSGPLCDAVTGQEDGGGMLETLEQGNLFVVPLDDKRHWFRYHRLFADVLYAHLMAEQADFVAILHQRASEWYEQNASLTDAVRHALGARDFERAADLIELAWPDMDGRFQTATWLGWVIKLPDEAIRVRPVLSTAYAWALLQRGELEAAELHLRNAETWLYAESGEMVVADEAQFQTLPATIASARAYHAQAHGDIHATVRYGQKALDLLPENDYLRRGIAASLLGVAFFANGELELAHHTLAPGMAALQTAGNLLFAIRGTYILADIRLAQGHLRDAIQTYEQSLQFAAEQGEIVRRGTADLYLRLSELYREQNNLETATQLRLRSEELGVQKASPIWQYRFCLAQARVKQAEGDLEGALDLLNEAERRYIRTPVPDIHPIGAMKARAWITQGRLAEALAWVQEQNLSTADDLSFLHEFEHITLVRILIARYKNGVEGAMHEAMGLLERLLEAAQAADRRGSMIEILAQQALAYEAQDRIALALTPLKRALALAEPEGYVRIFVDEGPPMAHLLSEAAAWGIMPGYARKLLAAFETVAGSAPPLTSQPLIEPLSERELEILALVAEGLSNSEISERLFISLSTVKGHNRNIFDKLQVKRRTEAVARARELGLI